MLLKSYSQSGPDDKESTMAMKRDRGPTAPPLLLESGVMPLARLKDLRKSAGKTQEDLAAALGVGQDTISRLEKRSDMLLSTLRHYVESVGGQLTLLASFPAQAPVVIDHLGEDKPKTRLRNRDRDRAAADDGEP